MMRVRTSLILSHDTTVRNHCYGMNDDDDLANGWMEAVEDVEAVEGRRLSVRSRAAFHNN